MTRATATAGADTVLAAVAAGVDLGRYQLLLVHTAASIRTLAGAPEVYTDDELAAFITFARRGRETIDGDSMARVYRRLSVIVEDLAAEVLLTRGTKGRPS
jgi:hypothetical protein